MQPHSLPLTRLELYNAMAIGIKTFDASMNKLHERTHASNTEHHRTNRSRSLSSSEIHRRSTPRTVTLKDRLRVALNENEKTLKKSGSRDHLTLGSRSGMSEAFTTILFVNGNKCLKVLHIIRTIFLFIIMFVANMFNLPTKHVSIHSVHR